MKTQTYFATCGGQAVQLTKVNMLGLKDLHFRAMTQTEPPANQSKHVRFAIAYGGGRPTEYTHAVGQCAACGLYHFAERMIERPAHASNHACNGRCMSATGKQCECSCKGRNHGAGAVVLQPIKQGSN